MVSGIVMIFSFGAVEILVAGSGDTVIIDWRDSGMRE
jgi:hypothetical protein